MNNHNYLIPTIAVGPPDGYSLGQFLPLDYLKEQLSTDNAVLELQWALYCHGKQILSEERQLFLENGNWKNPKEAEFHLEKNTIGDWETGKHISYLELSIQEKSSEAFVSNQPPPLYTVYAGPDRKTMLSDNSMKFADDLVINQIGAFGQWVVGYPACEVDKSRDVDYSILLLNPFDRPAVATLKLAGIASHQRVRVNPKTGCRISLASMLKTSAEPWTGQAFVYGKNRLVVFVAMHSHVCPSQVSSLEHIDVFRGAKLSMPLTRYLHWRFRSKKGLRK